MVTLAGLDAQRSALDPSVIPATAEVALIDAAKAALELASQHPAAAARAAVAVLDAAGRHDRAAASVAHRALGVAALQRSAVDDAVAHLRRAVLLAQRGGDVQRAAEARMSLASALAMSGRPGAALRTIDAAVAGMDGVPRARARVQRAAIAAELEHDSAALEDLRVALPVLRSAADVPWLVRGLSNRGVVLSAHRAFAAAEADLTEAAELALRHGLGAQAAFVEQNLGYLLAQRGDVPRALAHLSTAEHEYAALGMAVGALLLDRAETLLSVRLVAEGRAAADAAVRAFRSQHRVNDVPDAELLLATAALLDGDAAEAAAAADRACRAFARMHRRESLALGRGLRLHARALRDRSVVRPVDARRTARALADAGWTMQAAEAWLLAGELDLDAGRLDAARADLEQVRRHRRSGPAGLRARAWYAEAMLRHAEGRDRAAERALRAGVRVVEEQRATLGAVDLRAALSMHAGALVGLGLRSAVRAGSARRVLWWAEQGRTRALLAPPGRPPDDEALASALADLRAVHADLLAARLEGEPTAGLERRLVRAEHQVRDQYRRSLPDLGHTVEALPSAEEISAALGAADLLVLAEVDGEMVAVTLTPSGRPRLHALGPLASVRADLARLPFALRRAAGGTVPAWDLLADAATRLDARLLQPVRPRLRGGPLVVVPSRLTQSVPWSLLPTCHGRAVTVAPSVALFCRAWRSGSGDGRARGVVSVAGPDLPAADAEAAAVAAVHDRAMLLPSTTASAATVLDAADGSALLHVAAHGELRADNPLFSALRLSDGPLTILDLERLANPPRHVVLAACEAARAQPTVGEEVLGLGAALLRAGTTDVVAPVLPVPDDATQPVMVGLHEQLRAGVPVAAALAAVQHDLASRRDVLAAAAAAFVCLGYGQGTL